MGEIVVGIGLENYVDRSNAASGLRTEPVRRTEAEGVVDTGAVMLVLPQNVVEGLGLEPLRTAIVTCADERKEERPVAGPVAIEVCERMMVTECVVGPPLSEPLIGQIVLEALDLIADCANRALTPRTPDYPSLKLKKLSEEATRALEEGRADHAAGRTFTMAEIKRDLGIEP